jgi:lysophospholipase L1-like esterase
MRALLSATLVVTLLLGATAPAAATHPALRCTAPDGVSRFTGALPHTTRAIHRGDALVIVAIGSSSTEGVGASDQTHAYPAVLAEELRRRWPRLAVTVVNKGVSGETAEQSLARFRRDVLSYRPQLVIWQTGSIQVLVSEDVQGFEKTVRQGIARLKATHIDVILMDPQYAPRVLGRPRHQAIVDTIRRVANDSKVAVFRRFAVMRHWVTSGQYKMEDVISRDQLHMNDASYHCIARLLADSLAAAAIATPPPQTDDAIPTSSESRAGMATKRRTVPSPQGQKLTEPLGRPK